ncbi:MAG: hypothetical protein HOC23_11785 [Halieaceae bacterium]|jgi:hypothetical protein|nr:hypothetical protein [Halieaceae bacterium]
MKALAVWLSTLLVASNVSFADQRVYEADPANYDLMDALPAQLYDYTGHPNSIYWLHTSTQAPNLQVFAPDTHSHQINKVLDAAAQGGTIIEDLFEMTGAPSVHVYLVKAIDDSNHNAITTQVKGQLVILLSENDYTEHTFLHEYMHAVQRASGKHPYASAIGAFRSNVSDYGASRRWYVEGPPQFAPLITGAPDDWVNKDQLYGTGIKGRFLQAIRQAHGKSMVQRGELASLFWYYYFKEVHGGAISGLKDGINNYADQGYNNESMNWFDFKDYWHDFALAHVNKPGDKTGVWETIDHNFSTISASAFDTGEFIDLPVPFGDTVEMLPLSQKYFRVVNMDEAHGYVVFSLPDEEIPEGIEISALLRRTDSQDENWEAIRLDESALGKHWSMRFPVKGESYLENDADVPYDKIAFVISNYSDSDTHSIKPIITNHFRTKYEGRGVETKSGVKYVLTGTSILGVPRKGDGYRLVINKDEIRTRSLEMWFQRFPQIEFDTQDDDLDAKALMYVRDNGKFKGDVYFKYVAIRPEKVEKENGREVEEGKIVLIRERKDNFYTTPNLFKVTLDQQDLLIMFASDPKAIAAFTKKIEDVVKTKYGKGSFGGTLSQLFQQTMAIDTRAYGQEYEVSYKRGQDNKGHFLRIKLAESMWFTLRETELAGFQKNILN